MQGVPLIPEDAENGSCGLLGASTCVLVTVACPECHRKAVEVAEGTRLVRWRCHRCGEVVEWRGTRAA